MKVGDLVNWEHNLWEHAPDKKYESPGIVIGIDRSHRQSVAHVLWHTGEITQEHYGLLRPVEKQHT